MKCEVCRELLEEYLDGELAPESREEAGAHLITCAECAERLAEFSAEQELYTRYDRDVGITTDLWEGISEQIVPVTRSFVGWWMKVAAVLILTIGLVSVYLLPRKKETKRPEPTLAVFTPNKTETRIARKNKPKVVKRVVVRDNPGVISVDPGFGDIDEQDTAKHIEQTENLLRSIRNVAVSDSDDEVDVSYDKALSRRLLIENVVLRRDAEMKAKFPTKTLLTDLEPFLIDIANLPDRAKPEDVRAIKERVQKTEIVAALVDYQDRGPNNR